MKLSCRHGALFAAVIWCGVMALSGCSADPSQTEATSDVPKGEPQTTAAPDQHPLSQPSLKTIARRANYICRATITDVHSAREQYDPQTNMVMSRVSVSITKVYKGDLGRSMTFRAFGGELDGLPYYPSHFPQFHAGEDVILFLGDFNGGVFTVAHATGKYTVSNGRIVETGKTLEEFENEIKSTLQ